MKQRIVLIFLFLGLSFLSAQQIPSQITYCGIDITLTPGAQERLATYVAGIYESPRYYNAMVERAYTFMPFIEEALRENKAPMDLKFLAIQESSLKGDAVSSSNAVGYWQFKEPVANEFGLRVDRQVDERRHIFRSSQGAANYFKKANEDFDNYIYAVIAYYEGLTGAIPYTNPDYYGKRKMIVDENLHWYVMKAIAHKLAYKDALGMDHTPRVWLEPAVVERGTSLSDLSNKHSIEAGVLLEYNPWILDERRLPSTPFTYYIPRFDAPYPGHTIDPVSAPKVDVANTGNTPSGTTMDSVNTPEATTNPRPRPVINSVFGPSAQPVEARASQDYAKFQLTKDLHYGQQYVMVKEGDYLNTIADQNNITLIKLLTYNNLRASQMPEEGTVLYLNKSKKVLYHVVQKAENLGGIAARYGKSMKKLQKLNAMAPDDLVIFVGQKLNVKKKKPKGERLIILDKGLEKTEPSNTGNLPDDGSLFVEDEEVISDATPGPDGGQGTDPVVDPNAGGDEDFDGPTTEWVEHVVVPGETLWKISVAYGTKVEIIKLVNKLESDSISPGTKLRILAKKEKLEELNN